MKQLVTIVQCHSWVAPSNDSVGGTVQRFGHVYVVGSVRGGWSESGHTELTGVEELMSAVKATTSNDEILFGSLSTAYHLDLRLNDDVKPNIASVVFLNLSLPPEDIPHEIQLVRSYLPFAVFVLYADDDEFQRYKTKAPRDLVDRLPHFHILRKGEGSSFVASVRKVLDDAKVTAVRRRDEVQFYSCFISYSHDDKPFARKLCEALQGRGIHAWLDEKRILPGDKIHVSVDRAIEKWDKLLLCASKNSLSSWWVENEINSAITKEQQLWKQRGNEVLVLIPLNIDDYLFADEWQSGWKNQLRSRLAADFRGWDDDDRGHGLFDKEFENVVLALRADKAARANEPEPRL